MTGPDAPPSPAAPPPATPPPAPPRRRRGLWIALIASLTVNVFLVGWVASSWVYGPLFGPGSRWSRPSSAMAFHHWRAQRAVSGEHREAVRRIWRENLPELRERLKGLRESHTALRGAFAANGADAKSMSEASAAFKAKVANLFDHLDTTLLKIATTLPPDARKAYFSAGFPRHRERRERGSQ